MPLTDDKDHAIRYRKEHFAVEINKPDRWSWGSDLALSVTTNGTQWTSFGFSTEEADKVIAALQKWRKENP